MSKELKQAKHIRKYIAGLLVGYGLHILAVNFINLDAQLAWGRCSHISLPDRWEAWEKERICNSFCEKIVRGEL